MKSSKKKKSGASVPYHSKNDKRGAHLKKGTILTKNTKVVYRTGAGYTTGIVAGVKHDAAGVVYKNQKWITRKSLVRIRDSEDAVRITSRNDNCLVGVKI